MLKTGPIVLNVLYLNICKQIESYIKEINPTELIYISFDGVAPVAKLKQQRDRRFKGQYTKDILKVIKKQSNVFDWNTSAITPGTDFMNGLDRYVKDYFKIYNGVRVIFSGSKSPGEGEHKIMEHIRNITDKNKSCAIYGLDADLIMLALNHLSYRKQIYLYRETPEFIKSLSSTLEPNQTYLLNTVLLADQLMVELVNPHEPYIRDCKLHDYIFMCFMLGNDFMPHFPSLNIRTQGIYQLLNMYRNLFSNQDCLFDGKKVHWKNVRKLVNALSVNERDMLIDEYKKRVKIERRNLPNGTDEEREFKFMNIPTKHRQEEKYINPYETYWEERYYQILFDSERQPQRIKDIAINYLEGLEWNAHYYTGGCVNWRWEYKYNYPPLFIDLIRYVPYNHTTLVDKQPFNPVTNAVQLAYVMPKKSLYLLPVDVKKKVEHKDWYVEECEFKWSFCKYFWECHPVLPEIQPKLLEQLLAS